MFSQYHIAGGKRRLQEPSPPALLGPTAISFFPPRTISWKMCLFVSLSLSFLKLQDNLFKLNCLRQKYKNGKGICLFQEQTEQSESTWSCPSVEKGGRASSPTQKPSLNYSVKKECSINMTNNRTSAWSLGMQSYHSKENVRGRLLKTNCT